ncbi:hypothetical protein XI07_05005 [Bradyrhizobium sp. CCBAU 11445]|nr:hypothetical protein [Bradyrhizobium sp. CCBAU 11445]
MLSGSYADVVSLISVLAGHDHPCGASKGRLSTRYVVCETLSRDKGLKLIFECKPETIINILVSFKTEIETQHLFPAHYRPGELQNSHHRDFAGLYAGNAGVFTPS